MTLYEKLGGEQAVEQVVDDFYNRFLADDTVNHFFAQTDMNKQRHHQTEFIENLGLKPRASSTALLQVVGSAVKFVWAIQQ